MYGNWSQFLPPCTASIYWHKTSHRNAYAVYTGRRTTSTSLVSVAKATKKLAALTSRNKQTKNAFRQVRVYRQFHRCFSQGCRQSNEDDDKRILCGEKVNNGAVLKASVHSYAFWRWLPRYLATSRYAAYVTAHSKDETFRDHSPGHLKRL